MAEVSLPLREAQAGLPTVCAITGNQAHGAVSMRVGRTWTRWNSPSVKVPLSEPVFVKWSRRKNIHIKARAIASVLTAVAIVLTFRTALVGLAVLAVAVAVHLVDLWADRTGKQFQPELLREGSTLELRGVHDRFAEAIVEIGGERPRVG